MTTPQGSTSSSAVHIQGSSTSAQAKGPSSSLETVAQIHEPPGPAQTSVQESSEEDDDEEAAAFREFPMHLEFVKMIKDAQGKAEETQERAYYEWRGYKSSVFPTVPKFTLKDLKERLFQALKGVMNITEEEKRVNNLYIVFFCYFK